MRYLSRIGSAIVVTYVCIQRSSLNSYHPVDQGRKSISLLGGTINSKILENNSRGGTRNKSCSLSFIQHLLPQFDTESLYLSNRQAEDLS